MSACTGLRSCTAMVGLPLLLLALVLVEDGASILRGWRCRKVATNKTCGDACRAGHSSHACEGRQPASVAARDVDGMFTAAASGDLDAFGRATRHIGPVGRRDIRRESMRPIPGHVVGVGVMHIV